MPGTDRPACRDRHSTRTGPQTGPLARGVSTGTAAQAGGGGVPGRADSTRVLPQPSTVLPLGAGERPTDGRKDRDTESRPGTRAGGSSELASRAPRTALVSAGGELARGSGGGQRGGQGQRAKPPPPPPEQGGSVQERSVREGSREEAPAGLKPPRDLRAPGLLGAPAPEAPELQP